MHVVVMHFCRPVCFCGPEIPEQPMV